MKLIKFHIFKRNTFLIQGEEKVYELIKTCGLAPKKAKAIIETSRLLIEKHKGEVPNNMKYLEELSGVGHKTASVVISEFFKKPAFPVDTHIHRLSQRWGLTDGKSVVKTEEDLKSLFDKKGYTINWKELEKQNLNQTINTLAMASPFSLEEKQALLETDNILNRKIKLEKILNTYVIDNFSNNTLQ